MLKQKPEKTQEQTPPLSGVELNLRMSEEALAALVKLLPWVVASSLVAFGGWMWWPFQPPLPPDSAPPEAVQPARK